MIPKEEFEKAVNYCTGFTVNCEDCPLSKKDFKCGTYLAEYIKKRACTVCQQHKLGGIKRYRFNITP